MNEDIPLSDLPVTHKQAAVILIAAILATGLIEHQSVSVMQEIEEQTVCTKYDANGRVLVASIVLETYIQDEPKPHECHYAYRSDR